MSTPGRFAVSFLATVTLFLRTPAVGYEYPTIERGFKPERAFQVGDIDNIKLLNGGLELAIPIGPRFPVGPTFSYGLTLHYSNQLWDYELYQQLGDPPLPPPVTRAYPGRGFNAGFGWRLSLGEYWDASHTGLGGCQDCYVAPSGARHKFASELHPGTPTTSGVAYTKDGTFLRRRVISSPAPGVEIDFPSGEIHRFDALGRIIQMRDRFGNAVNISHLTNPSRIRLVDTQGRTQLIYLTNSPHYGTAVSSVVLTGFGTSSSTYTFNYANTKVPRSCLDDDIYGTSPKIELFVLTSVGLPDGSSFSMPESSYELDTYPTCGSQWNPAIDGLLSKVKLPTLGSIEWSWQAYNFPVPIPEVDIDDGIEPLWLSKTTGVGTRTLRRADGSIEAQWSYAQELPGGQAADESITRVTTPLGDRTDHYFTAGRSENVTYGLSYSPLEDAGFAGRSDLFRSSKVYDCASGGSVGCVLKRTTYLKYRADGLPDNPFTDYNARIEASLTRFHDDSDRWAAVDHSNWDGLGNWRQSSTSGNYASGNARTVFTNFNPGSGTYPGSFSLPSPTGPWVLGTYDRQDITENSSTARSEYCFQSATGFLLRQRTLANGTTRGPADVLTVLDPDGAGNVAIEKLYGGDTQAVGIGSLCAMGLPPTPAFELHHTYAGGVRATSRYFDHAAQTFFPYLLDRTIDVRTGLAASSRDSAGLQTTYEYDSLGRLTWEKPAAGHDAWTEYEYNRATSASALAKVYIYRRPNGSPTGGQLARSALDFDAFGRVIWESRFGADGVWRSRGTTYNGMGWRAAVSEWSAPGKLTSYDNYDPFGRPGTITPPDGAGHQVTLTYWGDRQIRRGVKVGTSATGATINEVTANTVERYDRQGRLIQLVEPSRPGGVQATTNYSYDVGGRLVNATTGGAEATQTRTFSYDNRGFLLSEGHPEKTGLVTYLGYNARGQATRKVDGPNDLTYAFDGAGRLTQVRETWGQQRDLKLFGYATANTNGHSRGKLLWAERYNHVVLGTNPITVRLRETYGYHGVGGRVSSRRTENYLFTSNLADTWNLAVSYTPLGEIASITYPDCVIQSCVWADTPRTINQGYNNGWLTSISQAGVGNWGTLTYHPNGMLANVTNLNNVVTTQGPDPNSMPRPAGIWTSGVAGGQNWSSGAYAYDGSGNIVKIGARINLYDHVSRITGSQVELAGGGTGQQGFTYDTFGNLTAITGSPGRTISVNSATNRLTGFGITYDTAGNLTSWGGSTYQYGPFNEIWRTATAGGEEWIHLYTADDQRLWSYRVTGSGFNRNRYTLRGLDNKVLREYTYNRDTLGWTVDRDLIYRDSGQLLASWSQAEGARHFHLDHLGTPRLITNASAARVAFHSYFPYGEEATAINQDEIRNKFTGHERDLGNPNTPEDDLDYMHARYHNPRIGRFLSVDPAASWDPAAPQTWNRYGYALGNPMKFVDPNGEAAAAPAIFAAGGPSVVVLASQAAPPLALLLSGAIIYQAVTDPASVTHSGLTDVLSNVILHATGNSDAVPQSDDSGTADAGGGRAGTAGGSRAGKGFTKKGKSEIDNSNAEEHGGRNVCENCGTDVEPGQRHQRGVRPPDNERQRDHIIPKSRGGDGDPSNGQVLCRRCNLGKGDR